MSDTRTDIVSNLTHFANFTRLGNTTPPRATTYLTDWRCSFGAISEKTFPHMISGMTVARWYAVSFIYDKNQLPQIGDELRSVRLIRTRREVKDRLRVVEVIPFSSEDLYLLLLTENASR